MTGLFRILTPRRAATDAAMGIAADLDADIVAAVAASRDWPVGLDPFEIVARLIALDAETPPDHR